ncbi:hypothetical protein MVEN_00699100 [Mycena venus]|uniref:Vacuolar protein 8 n=1 Tax=Mycena venus TaxID=2733690 RepID=A0A8H6YIQ9_9AGAR|nr:hypothetical protein MVEN_00699100 [Mycena venus]
MQGRRGEPTRYKRTHAPPQYFPLIGSNLISATAKQQHFKFARYLPIQLSLPSFMLSLTRQATPQSTHSWWSDSNPNLRGPTINLHAAAKPLMKLMYHRQVMACIKRNQHSPLSTPLLETYSSYIPWDYISQSTKAAIFDELIYRTHSGIDDARLVVNSPFFWCTVQTLKSSDVRARISSCRLIRNLALHELSTPVIMWPGVCEQLVSLLRDDVTVVAEAIYTLAQIAVWPEGAQAIGNPKTLASIMELLYSQSRDVCKRACNLIARLPHHEPTAQAILKFKPCVQLVTLLHDINFTVVRDATYALSQISRWSDGAEAIVDAKTLDHLLKLLNSFSPDVRKLSCNLVGNLASHGPTVSLVLELRPCAQLVTLLRDKNSEVVESAIYALHHIAPWSDGAEAIVNAKTLDVVLELLDSFSPEIQKWTCNLVGNLASFESTAPAVLMLKPWVQLVTLLRDNESEVAKNATYALSCISRWLDGAEAIVDSKTLDHALGLLISSSPNIRAWACMLVGRLANHKSTALAVLTLKPWVQLVTLLRDKDGEVVRGAIYALCEISCWLDGAQAIVNAKVLDHVLELLDSSSPDICAWTCELVEGLTSHESIVPAILDLKPCVKLVTLLHNKDPEVVESATSALYQIAHCPGICKCACKLLGNLANHKSTAPTVLELNPSRQLISLLREPTTRPSALFALCAISEQVDGIKALAELDVSEELRKLSQSTDAENRVQIHIILENLSRYTSIEGFGLAW